MRVDHVNQDNTVLSNEENKLECIEFTNCEIDRLEIIGTWNIIPQQLQYMIL